jgi:hypothetical protein
MALAVRAARVSTCPAVRRSTWIGAAGLSHATAVVAFLGRSIALYGAKTKLSVAAGIAHFDAALAEVSGFVAHQSRLTDRLISRIATGLHRVSTTDNTFAVQYVHPGRAAGLALSTGASERGVASNTLPGRTASVLT